MKFHTYSISVWRQCCISGLFDLLSILFSMVSTNMLARKGESDVPIGSFLYAVNFLIELKKVLL